MILTERQALQTWCQQTLLSKKGPMGCEGPTCMAWRWADINKKEGYCGLAGVPTIKVPESSE